MILKCEILQSNMAEVEEQKERFGDMPGLYDNLKETWSNGSVLLQGIDAIYESLTYKDSSVIILQSGASIVIRVNYEVLHSLWDSVDSVIGEVFLDKNSGEND